MNKYTIGLIVGVLSAGLTLQAQAQGLSPSEAKGTVPMVFEYNLAGPTTIESAPIQTAGTIKTISASYDFEGEVTLEVSANAGTSYTKIINGKPLTDGFIAGNTLCFKVNIPQGSILKKITLGFTDSSGVKKIFRNPDIYKFKYHKPIFIAGSNEELFNYPVKINLDRRDVYFTAADGQTPLYYYLEEGSRFSVLGSGDYANTKNLEPRTQYDNCWVKIPQIPKEGITIYLYCGDKQGLPPQGTVPEYLDANKVFPLFDDFSQAKLDETKWQVLPGLKKEYNLKDGQLQLKDCLILSRDFTMKQGILEFKAKAQDNASIQAVLREKVTNQKTLPIEVIVYSSNYPGAEHTIAINGVAKLNIGKPITPLTYYIYKVIVNEDGIIFERYSENYKKEAEIQFLDVGGLEQDYIGLKADAALVNAGSVYFDWVRVRPFVEVEPKVVIEPKTQNPEPNS